jgi:hypothetical protein
MNDTASARAMMDALKHHFNNMDRHTIQYATVIDVDVNNALVKVRLEPSDPEIITDFIRYEGMGMALGPWRGVHLPKIGAEVKIEAEDPDCTSFIATGSVYNGEDKPPSGYVAGQWLLQHTNGTQLLLDSDGMIYLGGKPGSDWLVFRGWIPAYFNPLVSVVNALISAFNGHTHLGNLGSPTGAPLSPFGQTGVSWSSGLISTTFKGI